MENNEFKVQEVGRVTETSPEVRYAQLHRDLERGMDSERLWAELFEVCLKLGKVGEAAQTLHGIHTPGLGFKLTRMLEEHGVILHGLGPDVDPEDPSAAIPPKPKLAATAPALGAPDRPPRAVPLKGAAVGPTAPRPRPVLPAPSAPAVPEAEEEDEQESLGEECYDALRFLLKDHMPLSVAVLALLFPVAATAGWLVPSGLGAWPTLVLRLIPILVVAGFFLHCANRLIRDAAQGNEDPPPVGVLTKGAVSGGPRALASFATLVLICLGPAGAAYLIGLPWQHWGPLALIGIGYLPLAILGISLRGSWEGALPGPVLRAIIVDFWGFFGLTGLVALTLSLPVLGWLASGSDALLQLAVGGPLLVASGVALARLLGRYYYAHAARLSRAYGLSVRAQTLLSLEQLRHARPASRRRRMPDRRPAPRIERRQPVAGEHAGRLAGPGRQVTANPPTGRRHATPSANGGPKRTARRTNKVAASTRPAFGPGGLPLKSGRSQRASADYGAMRRRPDRNRRAPSPEFDPSSTPHQLRNHSHTPLHRG